MDENTIFQGSSQGAQPVTPTPSAEKPQAANIAPAVSYVAKNESSYSSFPFGKIIKLVLGLIFLLVLVFLAIKFVLPIFAPKDTKVKLVYWGLWEDVNVMEKVISDFERANPLIDIEYKKEDPKQYQQRLLTRTNEGSGPDIFRFHNTWVPVLKDILSPLPIDVISKTDFQNAYYTVIQKDLIRNGAIYGIPLGIDTLSMFINTEVFSSSGVSVPTTWDDFGRIARTLTVKDQQGKIRTAGAAMGTFDNINHAPDIISLLMLQNGADLFDILSTKDNAADALDFYTQFAKPEGNVWDATLDTSLLSFAKGDLAMYLGFSWDVFLIKSINPSVQFQVVNVPHLPERNTTVASYWVEGASIKSKHKKEAMLFMKFLAQKETVQKLYTEASKLRLFGEPYARKDLAETLRENSLVYPFVAQAKDASSSFFASDTFDSSLNKKANDYLGDAVRSVLGNTSPLTAVETLAKGVAQVLAQYDQQ